MTTETRKRIRAYKKMLPELRERVIAVALLLAMSASMLGSASFAWITLSTAPEVSGMATTVEEAVAFTEATGVDALAIAIGTIMRMAFPKFELMQKKIDAVNLDGVKAELSKIYDELQKITKRCS